MRDIVTVSDLCNQTVVFAGSGGLDSMTCTSFLKEKGVKVVVMCADLGQPDEENIGDIEKRMRKCGVDDFILVPLQDELAEAAVKLLQGQGKYEGGYWNTTGIARHVIVKGLVSQMRELGLTILAHGCTGRGNDQFRFQWCSHHLDPNLALYAPWRDPTFLKKFPGRKEMIAYCEGKGLPIRHSVSASYSTDANMLGLTHEAGELEYLTTSLNFVKPAMTRRVEDAPNESADFSVTFERGVPTKINGKSASKKEAFRLANVIGGTHGIGLRHVVENRIVPFKSRGIYEQPGIELLGTCYEFMLQVLLDRSAREMFDLNSQIIGREIYNGMGFDLTARMAFAAISPVAEIATGTVNVNLLKGNIRFNSLSEVEHSLYDDQATSMEDTEGGFDHHDAAGMIKIGAQSARLHAEKGMTSKSF